MKPLEQPCAALGPAWGGLGAPWGGLGATLGVQRVTKNRSGWPSGQTPRFWNDFQLVFYRSGHGFGTIFGQKTIQIYAFGWFSGSLQGSRGPHIWTPRPDLQQQSGTTPPDPLTNWIRYGDGQKINIYIYIYIYTYIYIYISWDLLKLAYSKLEPV